jgi:acyl CoA:acetate/3-ketoacid CoA transferase alpha subunit
MTEAQDPKGASPPVGTIPILEVGEKPLIQPFDLDDFRESNRAKPKGLVDKRMSEQEAISRFVKDGDFVGIEIYGCVRAPMSLTRELVRQGRKHLKLAGQGVHEMDILLASGAVESVDWAYIGWEVYGVSPLVRRAVESGTVKQIVEWSNAALSWRYKAGAMGIPFIPCRTMLGTDTLRKSAAKVIECPFTGHPVALLPALVLDVGLVHVQRADKYGNCQIDGISAFAAEMTKASKRVIVSAEEIVDTDEVIRTRPHCTIIPYYIVDAVVHAPFGSHPGEMACMYERDSELYAEFMEAGKKAETTKTWFDKYIYGVPDHDAYLDLVGRKRLEALRLGRTC